MKPLPTTRPRAGLSSTGLYSTEIGHGEPLVAFCHGLFGQGRNWTSIAKALSDDATSLLIDMPNHGRSEWTEVIDYRAMAVTVGDLLAERSEGRPVTVVGHSMGGKIAMALALQRPALVERLCVVDIAPVGYDGLTSFASFVEGMRALDLNRLSDRAQADAGLTPYVPDATVRGFLLQNLRRDEDRWRWQMNLDLLGDHLAELGDFPDLHTEPYPGPVAWMAGARSTYVTPAYAPAMRALFPRVVTVTVKNAGHWVHSEQPGIVVQALRQFLRTPPASTPS